MFPIENTDKEKFKFCNEFYSASEIKMNKKIQVGT